MTPEERLALIKSMADGLGKVTTVDVHEGDVFVLCVPHRMTSDLHDRT